MNFNLHKYSIHFNFWEIKGFSLFEFWAGIENDDEFMWNFKVQIGLWRLFLNLPSIEYFKGE